LGNVAFFGEICNHLGQIAKKGCLFAIKVPFAARIAPKADPKLPKCHGAMISHCSGHGLDAKKQTRKNQSHVALSRFPCVLSLLTGYFDA
jgi:hypothetical protein